jgi:hypothetical protein
MQVRWVALDHRNEEASDYRLHPAEIEEDRQFPCGNGLTGSAVN